MWQVALRWIGERVKAMGGWTASLADPTAQTTEIRLISYGLFVFVGLGLIVLEFYETTPHHINNIALGTMAGACSLGTFSIPKPPQ